MSFYDNDGGSWSAPGRQPSWEHQQQQRQHSQPPSRSASASASAASSPIVEPTAFALQFEEIDRATDNLMKSGKWYPGSVQANASATGQAGGAAASRRDSMPAISRGHDYSNAENRAGGPQRHQSVTEFEGGRPGSAGLQGFYAGQRFPGGRQSEAEQVLQAKRRMAAQRERELRNYHQEQQYNRISGAKPDRAMSPTTMTEEDRRELIARQHRALYGDAANLYTPENGRTPSQDGRGPSGRGPSPLAFDPFGQGQAGNDGVVQMPPRDRTENTSSPVSNAPTQQSYNLMSDAQQSSRTSNSSPGASPPLVQGQKNGILGVAPIGTWPTQGPPSALGKRSTTPLTPSSLSYGFNASDGQSSNAGKDERSASSASNPGLGDKSVSGLNSWGSSSGVWGSAKNTLAVQPSVWG